MDCLWPYWGFSFVMNLNRVLVGRWIEPRAASAVVASLLLGACVPKKEHESALKMVASKEQELQEERAERESEVATLKALLDSERSAAKESSRALEAEMEQLKGDGEAAAKALEELP